MTAGRPTKYDPAYCEKIVNLAKEGKSVAEWAADIGVARSTLWEWAQNHEEFSAAVARAKTEEQAWFERTARENFDNRNFNAQLWIRSAQARFRDDYTESHKIESNTMFDFANLPSPTVGGITFTVIDAKRINQDQLTIDDCQEELEENE